MSATDHQIPIRNVYYLFAYAWDQFHFTRKQAAGIEDQAPDAASFYASILLQGCRQLFRRGLDRSYIAVSQETSRLRGRINVTVTLTKELLKQGRVFCEFDELQHDCIQNQLLKASLLKLKDAPTLDSGLHNDLRTVLGTFDAAGVTDIRLSDQSFRHVQLYRSNAYYAFLLHVCELANKSLLPGADKSGTPFAAMLDDEVRMSDLFERFVRNFYRAEQANFCVGSERISWDVASTGVDACGLHLLPGMKTDITLRSAGRTVIIDAKFYKETLSRHFSQPKLRSAHLYQMFAYLKNMEARGGPDAGAEGVLLYPTVQEDVRMRAVVQGHVLRVRTLDLSRPWGEIHDSLISILDGD